MRPPGCLDANRSRFPPTLFFGPSYSVRGIPAPLSKPWVDSRHPRSSSAPATTPAPSSALHIRGRLTQGRPATSNGAKPDHQSAVSNDIIAPPQVAAPSSARRPRTTQPPADIPRTVRPRLPCSSRACGTPPPPPEVQLPTTSRPKWCLSAIRARLTLASPDNLRHMPALVSILTCSRIPLLVPLGNTGAFLAR